MRYDIITIFPDIFDGFLQESLLARAQKKKLITVKVHDLRRWTNDRHHTVDDRPFGGGVGMVLKLGPIYKAVSSLKRKVQSEKRKTRVILFSPRGKKFDQTIAKRLSKYDQLILLCGRYEGVDERVADHIADEVISIGDYVISGGEVAAMVLLEAVSRLVPSFIAKNESAVKYDHAQYTRPEVLTINGKKLKVPEVLLSGNHAKIEAWRSANRRKHRQ